VPTTPSALSLAGVDRSLKQESSQEHKNPRREGEEGRKSWSYQRELRRRRRWTRCPRRPRGQPAPRRCPGRSRRRSRRLPPTTLPPQPPRLASRLRCELFLFQRERTGLELMGYLPGPAQPNGTSRPGPFFLRAKIFRLASMPSGPAMAETNEPLVGFLLVNALHEP
jgi:hypothetical protein